MIVVEIPLSAKWFYVISQKGFNFISTSCDKYSLPSGFWAFSRDELQEYFTSSVVRLERDETDRLWSVFQYDFVINNVQSIEDYIAPKNLELINGINSVTTAIKALQQSQLDVLNVIQNNTSIIMGYQIDKNTDVDLGAIMKSVDYSLLGSSDGFLDFYVPAGLGKAHGTLVLNVTYGDFAWDGGFDSSSIPAFSPTVQNFELLRNKKVRLVTSDNIVLNDANINYGIVKQSNGTYFRNVDCLRLIPPLKYQDYSVVTFRELVATTSLNNALKEGSGSSWMNLWVLSKNGNIVNGVEYYLSDINVSFSSAEFSCELNNYYLNPSLTLGLVVDGVESSFSGPVSAVFDSFDYAFKYYGDFRIEIPFTYQA